MFLCETALIGASYVAAIYLTRGDQARAFLIDQEGWVSVVVAAALMLLGMQIRELYSELRIRSRILLLQELSLSMGIVFIAEALMTYFQSSWALPRNVLLPGSALALFSVYAWRVSFSTAIHNRLGLQRVLFIGFPASADQLAGYLDRHPEVGFAPVGYLEERPAEANVKLPRLGRPADLQQAIEKYRPAWIVIGEGSGIAASQVGDLVDLRFGGVRIEDGQRFFERCTGRVHAASVQPAESVLHQSLLPSPVNRGLQSMYTTAVALLSFPFVVPLMGIIALTIRITTRRPALARETRIGLGGAPFTVYRLQLPSRHTAFGRLLVEWGIDRLPQIWNLLRGEMSLVGPEADVPEFANRLNQAIPLHSWRVLVPPGLTGWAQIRQPAEEFPHDAIRRLEYDLYYIKNLSPLLDLFIVLRRLRALLPAGGLDQL